MRVSKNIHDNLRFLIAEVGTQISNLQSYLSTTSASMGQRVLDRGGYAYNLKIRIHNSCLRQIAKHKNGNTDILVLRTIETISTDLERITELCRDCVHQISYLRNKRCLRQPAYESILNRVAWGVGLVDRAIDENDTRLALKIGRVEHKLNMAYRKLLTKYTADLKRGKHTEDLISSLFVAHSIEQMGDALLSISEAIISANLGQPVRTDHYHSLMASVEQLQADEGGEQWVLEPIAETRSGSGISAISKVDQDEGCVAIFKDGKKRKLKEERQGVESWHEIYPGLAPKILSYKKQGQSASLLIEHLAGQTYETILLHEKQGLLDETLKKLSQTLESVWSATRTDKPVSAQYMKQLARRLDDVYSIHPDFRQDNSRLCGHAIPSFESLLSKAMQYEVRLKAPFSVYIHGDFNVDNIIYDPLEKKINFIDLHRSRYMDYVQDISVFMVSHYRLQVLDVRLRRRIVKLAHEFYRFAAAYAHQAGDEHFEIRLALGLARSFATSTRFILDKSLANAMFMRARYLIEQVLAINPKQVATYRVPIKEIFIG